MHVWSHCDVLPYLNGVLTAVLTVANKSHPTRLCIHVPALNYYAKYKIL